jgi:molybdate transport system permease protein
MALPNPKVPRAGSYRFFAGMGILAAAYGLLIVGMLIADLGFTDWRRLKEAVSSEPIQYAIQLSLTTCTLAALLSLLVAIPAGYLLARCQFRGKWLLDAIFDIPIVLPPLVVGLSLLILFQTALGQAFEQNIFPVTYELPSVVLAQFTVAASFAVRTMKVTYTQQDRRHEDVARTLGCSRWQAFLRVVLPESRQGVIAAGTLAWARALGEFGPILVFSGATRMKTEVLPSSVFLELSVGNLEAALAVSLLMVFVAILVLSLARYFGLRGSAW